MPLLVAAHLSKPPPPRSTGPTRSDLTPRFDVVALVGVVMAGLALARPDSRFGTTPGDSEPSWRWCRLIAVVNGRLVLAMPTVGPAPATE